MNQLSPTSTTVLDTDDGEETEEMATASLFEVLTSHSSFLEEKELWALCRECCLTLEYIHDCQDLFQSLCISPDTVAFDAEGNVCFLDLDIEPESMYIAPEQIQGGKKSYKSHLFSLGMTLSFATKYNKGKSHPQAALSGTFTDLLAALTCGEIEGRPDIDTVIEACEKGLDGELSQEICMKIVEPQCCSSPESKTPEPDPTNQKMSDELCAYLESQADLLQLKIPDHICPTSDDNIEEYKPDCSNLKENVLIQKSSHGYRKDFNDNCLQKSTSKPEVRPKTKYQENGSSTLQDSSFDEDESLSEDHQNTLAARESKNLKGLLLADLLHYLDRSLDESELWSICRECVLTLQKRKKHLPAYISLDTIVIKDSGTVCFKAIPEDKPLEVIYMAPELQQKGILNDKTCLYGLGIVLRNAAGYKYSSTLSDPDAEALDILITSFTYGNPDKRPDLDTAFEMCEEYEQVSKTSSEQVCIQLFEEAHSVQGSLTESDLEKIVSFDNMKSLVPGSTFEAEDIKETMSDDERLESIQTLITASELAFKSLDNKVPEAIVPQSMSAFKNVTIKPKPVKDMNRVPSAFSSPATHFKPIVIKSAVTESAVSDQQISSVEKASKDSRVLPKNIKHNLKEPTIAKSVNRDETESGKSERESLNRKTMRDVTDLGQTLHQLQSQGHLPSTDVLASVLAHYFTDCLTDSASMQGHITASHKKDKFKSTLTTNSDASVSESSTQTFSAEPQYPVQPRSHPQMSYLPQQNINHNSHGMQQHKTSKTITASKVMPTQHIPKSASGKSSDFQENAARDDNSEINVQKSSSNMHVAGSPLTQASGTFTFPVSTSGVVNHSNHYAIPFSGLSPSHLPVQYTLVPDPATGLMQMVPVPYVPISHAQTSQGIPFMQSYLPSMDVNCLPTAAARLYKTDNRDINWSYRFSQEQNMYSSSPHKISSWQERPPNNNMTQREEQFRSHEKCLNGYPLETPNYRTRANHQQNGDDNHIHPCSSSPSKFSRTFLNQKPGNRTYTVEMLMDRQQNSSITDRHKTFSNVIHILHETFVEDGLSAYGIEDFAIAEYVMSLSSLTWDTFRNAVTEKYFHLVWSYQVLSILFEAIGGHKSPEFKNIAELPPEKFNMPQHKASGKENTRHQQSEIESGNSNRQERYLRDNHQQQDRQERPHLSHQHQQGPQERPHLSHQHQQGPQERQQFSKQPQQEKYTKHHEYNQHKVNSQNRQLLPNHIHPVKAAADSLSHPAMLQHSLAHLRPRSETGRHKFFFSEASDSTDSEARDRKHHFKKRHELDNTKRSTSLHNLNFTGLSSTAFNHGETEENQGYIDSSARYVNQNNQKIPKDYYKTKSSNYTTTNKSVPLQICQDQTFTIGQKISESPHSDKTSMNSSKNSWQTPVSHPSSVHPASSFPDSHEVYRSPPVSVVSHSSSKSDISQEHKPHDLSTFNCPTYTETTLSTRQKSQHSQESNDSNRVTINILPSPIPYTHSTPYLPSHLPINRDYTDSGHSKSSSLQPNSTGNSQKQLSTNGHNINPHPVCSNKNDEPESQRSSTNTKLIINPVRPPRNSVPLDYQRSQGQKHDVTTNSTLLNVVKDQDLGSCLDSDINLSAEMRKLAAEKPELYNDRCLAGLSMPQDKGNQIKHSLNTDDSQNSHTLHTEMSIYKTGSQYSTQGQKNNADLSVIRNRHDVSNNVTLNPNAGCDSFSPAEYKPSLPDSKTQSNSFSDNKANRYNRSFSAVYSRQSNQPQTGVTVIDSAGTDSMPDTFYRRGSDGSVQLPEINSVLLPYIKKSSIVYHSAMIQLSLTPEVEAFINSIDEENRPAIEKSLASVTQEIMLQRRQRQKSQRLYKKLNEQTVVSKKGDQNVSDQTLRDMADMTRKLSFLQLCQTHLQMLLAELHGLDSSLLHSLSICEGSSHLSLQPVPRNPYLQFRSISTVEAEQITVLQAGTPRGIMSYLFTSSALSNGYIHQFFLCFRYIMTADQLLTFVLEKYHSAQRNSPKDMNMICIQRRSIDLLHFWIEGYYSVDFALNKELLKKFSDFLTEQTNANVDGTDNLFSLYAACRLGENTELMKMTDMDDDNIDDGTYFLYLDNPKRWDSFRSLLKRSKSDKSSKGYRGGSGKSKASFKMSSTGNDRSSIQFSVAECSAHVLAEQLTLIEQELFKKCHPVQFLNSQFQGVGVALSMPGLRTPSMSRKSESNQGQKRGLFVGEPAIESYVVHMISHAQELAHWVSAEILSCGSNKAQTNVIVKFLTAAHLCQHVRNYATAFSILDGLENLVVRQLPVWKNIPAKVLTYMDELTVVKMKLKSEALWLMSEKDCHIYPTIPCALFIALHIQQAEIGSFTLASGMYKWDKMRSISETVDQLRIFRDHEYGFLHDFEVQRSLRRCLSEYSEQDLHAVASTQNNNFQRHPSSTSLSGTLKKVKDMLKKKN